MSVSVLKHVRSFNPVTGLSSPLFRPSCYSNQFAFTTPLVEIRYPSMILTPAKLTICILKGVYSPNQPRYIINKIIESLHSWDHFLYWLGQPQIWKTHGKPGICRSCSRNHWFSRCFSYGIIHHNPSYILHLYISFP